MISGVPLPAPTTPPLQAQAERVGSKRGASGKFSEQPPRDASRNRSSVFRGPPQTVWLVVSVFRLPAHVSHSLSFSVLPRDGYAPRVDAEMPYFLCTASSVRAASCNRASASLRLA